MYKTRKDFSMRVEHTGSMALVDRNEYICNVAQRLFHMIPGMDDYNKEMGLDIMGRARQPYEDGYQDVEFEEKVVEQFRAYTDILPTTVVAKFMNHNMVVMMSGVYNGYPFDLRISSDPKYLRAEILPKRII